MIRKSPTESATLYNIGIKKKGNDGNTWIVTELSNGVKRWKLFKKSTQPKVNDLTKTKVNDLTKTKVNDLTKTNVNELKITKLGLLFLDFIKDESLFPNSPDEVKNLNKDLKKIWTILKQNKFIGTVPKTKYVDETYYIDGKEFIYFVNIACEIANMKKIYYEPAKLTDEGKQLIIQELKNVKFIE